MITRRRLLELVGLAGGAGAVYRVAAALGAFPAFPAAAAAFSLPPAQGKRHVLVLGAGVAGLVSAYELERAGYTVEILEAAPRIGGRVLTLRHGDVVDEIGNRQVCNFDDHPDLYFNAGASRIPSTHDRLIGYCRTLGVPLETHVNMNSSAWLQYDGSNGGQRIRQREFNADARGFMAELMAKGLSQKVLETPLSADDAGRLLEFVVQYGDLDSDLKYHGSSGRAGYAQGGLYVAGTHKHVHELTTLLRSDFWRSAMHFGEGEAQSSVLQPVGGMDRIIKALASKLSRPPQLGAQVVDIRTGDDKVTVQYRQGNDLKTATGDYCLDSIPGQLLAGIPNNFSAAYNATLRARPRGRLGKIAFQMRERFWEREGIYGGISWTGQDIGQIQYPSHGFNGNKGIVIGGYYLQQDVADRFQVMSARERFDAAVAQGERLHPGYGGYVENGVSVAWYRMNHMLGCTARDTDAATLEALRRPEGRHYLVGDQISAHAGWQEAAVLAAHDVLERIGAREREGVRS